jgi:hypothetical protein
MKSAKEHTFVFAHDTIFEEKSNRKVEEVE